MCESRSHKREERVIMQFMSDIQRDSSSGSKPRGIDHKHIRGVDNIQSEKESTAGFKKTSPLKGKDWHRNQEGLPRNDGWILNQREL